MGRWLLACAVVVGVLLVSLSAGAQPFTGYELALTGSSTLTAGRTNRLRGVAYRVRGVAELVPFEGEVRARLVNDEGVETAWVTARAESAGTFSLALPVPAGAEVLEVEVGPDADSRRFELPIAIAPPFDVMLRTDRQLYEPGEPVHVWALVRDAASGRPITGRALEIEIDGEPVASRRQEISTGESGVAELSFELLESAPEGSVTVRLALGALQQRTSFRVGTRTWERLLATVEVTPDEVAPHGSATAHVRVTTASGAPVRGARVEVTVDGRDPRVATTDDEGLVDIEIRAPAYLVHETGFSSVRARISHPAHGSLEAFGAMRLAVPLALEVEVMPRHGALVPELDDVLYVRLQDGAGDPPPAGTEVIVEGAAVPGGSARAETDDNGLAEIRVRLPLGSAASDGDEITTSLLVRVAGPLERLTRIEVPVARDPEVVPNLARPVLAPGDRVDITLTRRPSARSLPIVVDLLGPDGALLASRRVAAGRARTSLDVPSDRLGLLAIRARAVHEDESLEGQGMSERLIVRPAGPDFVRVEPTRERWTVGETARLRLHTGSGGPRAFAAVLVRDLAAHGGERPFTRSFLQRAFDRAVLDPSGPNAERLVRAALAAHATIDPAPATAAPLLDALGMPSAEAGVRADSADRGVLRDPWPHARELARRGVGPWMRALEDDLEEALAAGALDALTEGAGPARRFRELPIQHAETLGGSDVTPSLLHAVDPSFTYESVARRVARVRLVRLMVQLAGYLDPGEEASPEARMAAREPWVRWLPRMVERGVIEASDLADPWGGRFTLQPTRGQSAFALSTRATRLELVSPGPDGRAGTADDVRDPFERVVPAGTPYAVASGEDRLMRALAILSVTERTLHAITEAYSRTNAEVMAERIGDAVSARVSEGSLGVGGLGIIGHGAGGGGVGHGYGSGHGRAGSTPRVRVGQARRRVSGLARVVRERFPPTLFFEGSIALDPSGVTEIEVPLADAVTTYLVEAIVWREDGWIWSDATRFEVDRDIVVDAPVPAVARIGDRLRLPVRVSNRGDEPREVRVRLMPAPALGVAGSAPAPVTLAPGDAAVVPVELALDRVGESALAVVVTDAAGEALDAVRRPIRVRRPGRRVHVERDALAVGEGALELVVPEGAEPRRGRLRLSVGFGMFDAPDAAPWRAWGPSDAPAPDLEAVRGAVQLAFALGAEEHRVADAHRGLVRLTTAIDQLAGDDARSRAMALIGLAPFARTAPDELGARALLERVARDVSRGAVASTEDPSTWVAAAAGLGWSLPDAHRSRIAELVRRLDRHTVEIGEARWLPIADAPRSTVLLAMAELSLGRRERAFVLLRTVARWAALGHPLTSEVRALARAAADRLMRGERPASVVAEIDGAPREVRLTDGTAALELPSLASPGRHVVHVLAPRGAPIWVRADVDFGVPWTARPPRPGPMRIAIEGAVGGLGETSELELVVVNRAPRTLPRPVIELELPTGAELSAADRARIRAAGARVTLGEGVMTLRTRPMRPGNEVRIPLPLRWSVAGVLGGLGAVAYAEDRPEDVTVLPPRTIVIEEVSQ